MFCRGKVTGLCGDCNSDINDDLNTRDGQPTSGDIYVRFSAVGDSYQVDDPEETALE